MYVRPTLGRHEDHICDIHVHVCGTLNQSTRISLLERLDRLMETILTFLLDQFYSCLNRLLKTSSSRNLY